MPSSKKSNPSRRSNNSKRRSNSPHRTSVSKHTLRKNRTPSPGKKATREQTEVYYLAKAHKTLTGSPLRKFLKSAKAKGRKKKNKTRRLSK